MVIFIDFLGLIYIETHTPDVDPAWIGVYSRQGDPTAPQVAIEFGYILVLSREKARNTGCG